MPRSFEEWSRCLRVRQWWISFFPFADLVTVVAMMARGGGSTALSPPVLHCVSSSKLFWNGVFLTSLNQGLVSRL